MLTSFGFWWYANIAVSNLLLGILLFELFHDVQYLSIVWVFNRSRAARAPEPASAASCSARAPC